jgi:hypothetical protein
MKYSRFLLSFFNADFTPLLETQASKISGIISKLLAIPEDSATLRSDMSAVYGI